MSSHGWGDDLSMLMTSEADYIHDIKYNFYGNKLAAVTSSKSIKIFDNLDSGDFTKSAEIQNAHTQAIWRVDWAHPHFGEILTTCSEDRTICVWSCVGKEIWKRRASLGDSLGAVSDVKFAPKQFGLRLAACGEDGSVRVYEATNILTLGSWEIEDFSPFQKLEYRRCNALSWCPQSCAMLLAVLGENGRIKVVARTRRMWDAFSDQQLSM
eukprot:GHVL01017220.1.p1 GENE.GHVL01017220.1~~GHVL01017220.1.p1  ORF type:complete len:211 (-),score=30.48 GHVL01017220.1:496-1128(-)